MKKPMKFTKDVVKQVAGAQLATTTGGLTAWDPDNKKEIVGRG